MRRRMIFTNEPLSRDHPFRAIENVIISLHRSSAFDGWAEGSAQMFAQNLHRYRQGQALQNNADPGLGY